MIAKIQTPALVHEAAIKYMARGHERDLARSEYNMTKLLPAPFLFSIVNEVKRRIINEPKLNIPSRECGSYVMLRRENALLECIV